MGTHLFVYPGGALPRLPAGIAGTVLPREPAGAADAVDAVVRDESMDVVVFWDPSLGAPPWAVLPDFRASLDDVWHAGTRITGANEPDLLQHVLPLWIYRPAPPPDSAGAINWRVSLRAAFVRARLLRGLGGLDRNFDTLPGVARELGLRLIRRGAICRQRPELVSDSSPSEDGPSLKDRYRLLRRQVGAKWTAYTLARRVIAHPSSVLEELRAWAGTSMDVRSAAAPVGAIQRDVDHVKVPAHLAVSVVLPTFGRYRYVAEVLDDLRAQTIAPTQILIADGNPPAERQPEVYERYKDLPIEVIWHEQPGICSGRNACLERATGEYVWFVDDDSRFDARNLESHLRVMLAYGADVSVGPAYMKGRPELAPEQREIACSFMDCGTTLCRRTMLSAVGGFDMQFNQYLAGEDNDLGIRFIRAAGLIVNNPLAKRFHYLAPVGGSRSKGSVHKFRRWSLLPRPVQSVYYLSRRHFEPTVVWDAMLHASITVGWRRANATPSTPGWRAKNLVAEVVAAPLTAFRFFRSAMVGRRMVEEGPRIPPLPGSSLAQRGRITPK